VNTSRSNTILIIGAGIAGLAAGCYGQMNGYRTKIFELHSQPGGLCTAWKRQGYTFDGCIHWLVGSERGSFHRVWQELGAAQGQQMVNQDEFTRVEDKGGKTLIVYTNADRLEQHLKELSPADAKPIGELCSAIRALSRVDSPLDSLQGLWSKLQSGWNMLPMLGIFAKYGKLPMEKLVQRFSDPFLREAFQLVFDLPDFPVVGMLMTLGWMHNRNAGYPIGGSLEFARAIERRYLELGGELYYNSRVSKILVENDRAVGVRLSDGTEHRADATTNVSAVISAADGHATIFDMLEAKYVNDQIRSYYERLPIFAPIIQVSLGVARDLSDTPHMVTYPLDEPITIAGEAHQRMGVKHYGYDPTLAPAGKSVIEVMFPSNYDYWKSLYEERERYDAEKKQIALTVMGQLDKRFPGLIEQVEVVDVATPMTYERYTGNWQGSMEGWLITTKTMMMRMDKTLPGLQNFYMAGQWVEPGGGLPTAAMSGRGAIQAICKQDKRRFVTQLA
jgi:phytoene dehydrogenase-like protein